MSTYVLDTLEPADGQLTVVAPAVPDPIARHSFAKILVATDAAPSSDAALVQGWVLAERHQARLEVLTVYNPSAYDAELAPLADLSAIEHTLYHDAVRARLQRQMDRTGVRVPRESTLIRVGDPAETIVRVACAADAGLIVLGLRSHTVLDRVLGRETALRVVRSSDVPVLTVTNGQRWLPRSVVAAVDFEESSAEAAQAAIDAVGLGQTVVLAHVVARHDVPFAGPESDELRIAAIRASFDELLRRLVVPPRVRLETVVLRGEAGHELLTLARRERAELIVAGSHGRSAVGRLVMGSVATHLLRQAQCSVFVLQGLRH